MTTMGVCKDCKAAVLYAPNAGGGGVRRLDPEPSADSDGAVVRLDEGKARRLSDRDAGAVRGLVPLFGDHYRTCVVLAAARGEPLWLENLLSVRPIRVDSEGL